MSINSVITPRIKGQPIKILARKPAGVIIDLAGLLTYPYHCRLLDKNQWSKDNEKMGITAASTVPASHRIPFSPENFSGTKSRAKIRKKFDIEKKKSPHTHSMQGLLQ